jgi:threonine efflux protein
MDYLTSLAALAGMFFVGVISPGPNFVLVTATATKSRTSAFLVAIGFCLAALTWAAMSVAGLAVILSHVGWLYRIVQLCGAFYLAYLGLKLLRGERKADTLHEEFSQPPQGLEAVRKGFLVNIFNPKSAAFYTSIFATLLPHPAPVWVNAVAVGITGTISLGWYGFVGFFFSMKKFQHVHGQIATVLDKAFGALLLGLGVRLAFATRQ